MAVNFPVLVQKYDMRQVIISRFFYFLPSICTFWFSINFVISGTVVLGQPCGPPEDVHLSSRDGGKLHLLVLSSLLENTKIGEER